MNNPLEVFVDISEQIGFKVFCLDGKKIHNKTTLLNQTAEIFKFPSYFGHNWDALYDCITNLKWMDKNGAVIIFSDTEHFRLAAPDDWQTANSIFLDAVDFWKHNNKQLYLFFI